MVIWFPKLTLSLFQKLKWLWDGFADALWSPRDVTWVLVHSYADHTTHFLEHVTPMFLARHWIPQVLKGFKALDEHHRLLNGVHLLNIRNVWDWMDGVLATAAGQKVANKC